MYLTSLRACFTRVFYVLAYLASSLRALVFFASSCTLWTWLVYVFGELHKTACLACFKNGVHGVLHKMTCLNLPNCFLGVFDHRVIVNYRFWMPSDVFNGTQESAKPIFTIFVFVLNLEFLVWVWIFIHIYKNQKQISWLSSINLKFSLPVSSNKVKKFLQREESFDSFIKLYDQIEQIFNTAVKFMWKPNSDGNYLCY